MRMSRTIVPLAAALVALAGVSVGAQPALAATPTKHVVVFGLDGTLFDRIAPADAPNLDALIASGYSSKTLLYTTAEAPTLSGPGWATNLTGVWPNKHLVKSNTWGTTTNLAKYPDFLTRVENSNHALTTYADVSWNPIVDGSVGTPIITSAVDTRYAATSDADAAAKAVAKMKATGPNLTFIHFDGVDAAGHASGAASQAYLNAIHVVDGYIGQVRAAIKARPTFASESWTFIVTADHGMLDTGGHGGNTTQERSSFIVEVGPGIAVSRPSVQPKNVDIAPTVLTIFGVPLPSVFDGKPIK